MKLRKVKNEWGVKEGSDDGYCRDDFVNSKGVKIGI